MRSITRRFNLVRNKQPQLSDHSTFAVAVTGMQFNKRSVEVNFDNLVDEDDYDVLDRDDLIKFMMQLTKSKALGKF